MKPLDKRLLRYARDSRGYIIFVTVTGILTAGLIIAQALLIAWAMSPIITGEGNLATSRPYLWMLAAVLAARIVITIAQERYAHRAASAVIRDLREQVVTRAADLGHRWLADGNAHPTVMLTTRGLDDLEPYFVRYLPQLLLSATVTPATVAVVLGLDFLSAVIVVVCIPLIPIFMILIGKMTQSFAAEKLQMMQRLGSQLLDLLAGLTTLKALGRERGPGARVAKLGRAYTSTTMSTLRVAFLSGAALEFIATLSTALVAVEVGFRLVYGRIDLTVGLAIIMLTPEIFKPLREVGSQFHASADGVAAAEQAFSVLEKAAPSKGSIPCPDLKDASFVLDNLSVIAPGRDRLAPAHASARIEPGTMTALVGPSGSGKTTTVSALLGLLAPDEGRVGIDMDDGGRGVVGQKIINISDIERSSLWKQVTWIPQRPAILPGSVAANVCGGLGDIPRERLNQAARATGFAEVIEHLDNGWETTIGHGGVGLSVGQRQRLALTRALVADTPVVIFDEPTAHLDAASEEVVLAAVQSLKDSGRTVIMIAHRPSVIRLADQRIEISHARLSENSEVRA